MSKMPFNSQEMKSPACEATWQEKLKGFVSRNLLLIVTIGGVFFGVILGFALRPAGLSSTGILVISYPGEIFMRLLKLMILPLVISSLISGAASLNAKMSGKIAFRTIGYFLATSLLNAILGVVLVVLIHPGQPFDSSVVPPNTKQAASILDSFLDLGRNMFPDNLFQAAFEQTQTVYEDKNTLLGNGTQLLEKVRMVKNRSGPNTLGVICFCLVFGSILGTIGKRAQPVVDFFLIIDEAIMRVVRLIMWITPIGVASVICGKILEMGDIREILSQLALFIVTVLLGVFIYQWIILQLIYFFFVRKNPLKFYFGVAQAWFTAFATASTAAALPVTFRCMEENNGVDERISKFVLPIGATVNMDGTALFVSIASIFIAQMNLIPLGIGQYATVAIVSTAISVAAASVPSAALALMLMVLDAISVPSAQVSLLFTVDWFVDRFRTTNNLLGDCYTAAIVEQWSKAELRAMDEELHHAETEDDLLKNKEDDDDLKMVETSFGNTKATSNGHSLAMTASTTEDDLESGLQSASHSASLNNEGSSSMVSCPSTPGQNTIAEDSEKH